MWLTFRAHEWSGWLHRIQLNLWYLTLLITSRHPGCRNVIRWQKLWRSPDRISCYSRIQTNYWMIFFFCFVPFKVWRRRLVLRHKLTMHTAFAREDNSAPAAITSLLVSKWVLWFLWTDQSIDRENDRPNSRPNERSTDWTNTGTADFSIDRRTNEWTNGKRRTINDERWIKNDQQWTTNKRTKKRASERKNDRTNDPRMNERTNRRTTNGATDAFLKRLLTQPDIFSALVVVNDHVKDSATLLSELNTDRFPLFTGIIASYLLEISADGSTVGLWLTPQVWTDHADKYTHITLSRILHTKIHGIFRITIIV